MVEVTATPLCVRGHSGGRQSGGHSLLSPNAHHANSASAENALIGIKRPEGADFQPKPKVQIYTFGLEPAGYSMRQENGYYYFA